MGNESTSGFRQAKTYSESIWRSAYSTHFGPRWMLAVFRAVCVLLLNWKAFAAVSRLLAQRLGPNVPGFSLVLAVSEGPVKLVSWILQFIVTPAIALSRHPRTFCSFMNYDVPRLCRRLDCSLPSFPSATTFIAESASLCDMKARLQAIVNAQEKFRRPSHLKNASLLSLASDEIFADALRKAVYREPYEVLYFRRRSVDSARRSRTQTRLITDAIELAAVAKILTRIPAAEYLLTYEVFAEAVDYERVAMDYDILVVHDGCLCSDECAGGGLQLFSIENGQLIVRRRPRINSISEYA